MLRTVVLRPTQLDPVLGSAVDTWATVAVAIGMIGTVVYALFRDYFVTARRRPRLDLRFDRAGNDQVVIGTEGGSDAAYARLRVANQPGKDTADDVVVMVTELRRPGDEEAATTAETRPIGLPLRPERRCDRLRHLGRLGWQMVGKGRDVGSPPGGATPEDSVNLGAAASGEAWA